MESNEMKKVRDTTGLSVGDKLALKYHRAGYKNDKWFHVTVENITPKGRVTLTDGTKLRPNGEFVGSDVWHSGTAYYPSEAIDRMIKREGTVAYIHHVSFKLNKKRLTTEYEKLSDEQLIKLADMLQEVDSFLVKHVDERDTG